LQLASASCLAYRRCFGSVPQGVGQPNMAGPIQEVLDLVNQSLPHEPDSGHNLPGTKHARLHAAMMRAAKYKCPRSATKVKVAAHVKDKVDKANKQFAVRASGLIDISEREPQKVKGRGAYRHWTPQAIARVCFGAAGSCHPLRSPQTQLPALAQPGSPDQEVRERERER
jgi:hypothetical protein